MLRRLCQYKTQKMVQIESLRIALVHRILQLTVLTYFCVWVIWFERGYQSQDNAISGVTTKLKGVSFLDLGDIKQQFHAAQELWDQSDYVVPPQQNSAFFVTTNAVITPQQTQAICSESEDVHKIGCQSDDDCVNGEYVMLGSGIKTGRCVISVQNSTGLVKVCEVQAWCPTENDELPLGDKLNLIANAPNFTVLIRNSIEFPKNQVKQSNILPWMNKTFLHNCRHNPSDQWNKYCPIFRLGDILNFAGANTRDIWLYGGMVSINIEWDCNLDYSVEHCVPQYSFRRLDDAKSPIAKGWNFRYAFKYVVNDVEHRTLIKAYGIQFFITVYGTGYKFDWYTLTMNVGSGIGLLGIATVLCDAVILNMTRHRDAYRNARLQTVTKKEIRRNSTKPKNNTTVVSSDEEEDQQSKRKGAQGLLWDCWDSAHMCID